MNYTNTKWFCWACSRKTPKGYGCESNFTESGEYSLKCEECGELTPSLYRFRIPEKDIRFEFVSSYRHFASWNVRIDGKLLTYPGSDGLARLEYIGGKEAYMSNLSLAIQEGFNVKTEEELRLNFTAWINTIHYECSNMLISDDIRDAFQIYGGSEVRRAIYCFEWENPEDPKAADYKQINQRVEYY